MVGATASTPKSATWCFVTAQADVDSLAGLLPRMLPEIAPTPKRLGQALLRGRFMRAVAEMEWAGVPIDTQLMASLRKHWDRIKLTLIEQVDARYDVFEGGSLRQAKLELLVKRMGIDWPRTATGLLSVENDTFKDQARTASRAERAQGAGLDAWPGEAF